MARIRGFAVDDEEVLLVTKLGKYRVLCWMTGGESCSGWPRRLTSPQLQEQSMPARPGTGLSRVYFDVQSLSTEGAVVQIM